MSNTQTTDDGERVQVGPRLSKSLVDRLWAIARRDGRTFNSVLEEALNGYVEREEKPLPDDLISMVEKYVKRQERNKQIP